VNFSGFPDREKKKAHPVKLFLGKNRADRGRGREGTGGVGGVGGGDEKRRKRTDAEEV